MKYLVIGRIEKNIPFEKGEEINKASMEWIEKRLKKGTIDCHHIFIDNRAGMVIQNANSHEELSNDLMTFPMYQYFSWEIIPLCEWKQHYEIVINMYKNAGNDA